MAAVVWAKCSACGQVQQVATGVFWTGSKRERTRLRWQVSPCCGAKLRAARKPPAEMEIITPEVREARQQLLERARRVTALIRDDRTEALPAMISLLTESITRAEEVGPKELREGLLSLLRQPP